MIIGITGRSGSGKSTLSNKFKEKNCVIVNLDEIARTLLNNNKEYQSEIKKLLGNDVISEYDVPDRKKISMMLFNNPSLNERFKDIAFKYIEEETLNQINKFSGKNIILDAPTLLESNLKNKCDIIIFVDCSDEVAVDRIVKRDSISKGRALSRLNAQKSRDFFIENTHIVIDGENIESAENEDKLKKHFPFI